MGENSDLMGERVLLSSSTPLKNTPLKRKTSTSPLRESEKGDASREEAPNKKFKPEDTKDGKFSLGNIEFELLDSTAEDSDSEVEVISEEIVNVEETNNKKLALSDDDNERIESLFKAIVESRKQESITKEFLTKESLTASNDVHTNKVNPGIKKTEEVEIVDLEASDEDERETNSNTKNSKISLDLIKHLLTPSPPSTPSSTISTSTSTFTSPSSSPSSSLSPSPLLSRTSSISLSKSLTMRRCSVSLSPVKVSLNKPSDMKKCSVSLSKMPVRSKPTDKRHVELVDLEQDPPCEVCGQVPDQQQLLTPLPGGVAEVVAVKEERVSAISWEDSRDNDWPLTFKVVEVAVHDHHGHLVPYDKGLVERDKEIYLSGKLTSILDDKQTVVVNSAGPVLQWRKFKDKVILSTVIEGVNIEYHIGMKDFSQQYRTALKRVNFYDSISQVFSQSNLDQISTLGEKERGKDKLSVGSPAHRKNWHEQLERKNSSSTSTREQGRGGSDLTKLNKVLASLGQNPGVGKPLTRLLPGHQGSEDAIAAFLYFVYERQKTFQRKYQGETPHTNNDVIATKWFTNMYRECDRGTAYFKQQIFKTVFKGRGKRNKWEIDVSLIKDVVLKSISYRLINKVETFMNYGGFPDHKNFQGFVKFLKQQRNEGVVIFTGAHQNMGHDRLMKTFDYVYKNIGTMAENIGQAAEGRSLNKIQRILQGMPNVGGFFAWQILCDLLEARVLGRCTDNQWTCLGPGSKNGLAKLFGSHSLALTRLVRDLCSHSGENSGFLALGLQFPAFLGKPLSLKNVEHALCEFDKYFRYALEVPVKERGYTEFTSRTGLDDMSECGACSRVTSQPKDRVLCPTCGTSYHTECRYKMAGQQKDGTWLCVDCEEDSQVWDSQDFSYEEYDKDANCSTFVAPKKSSGSVKVKKMVKAKKLRDPETITLSSDEEDDDEEVEIVEESDDDEVEFLAEMEGHFFGADTTNLSDGDGVNVEDGSNAENHLEDVDPFADVVQEMVESSSSKDNFCNTLNINEEEIMILG